MMTLTKAIKVTTKDIGRFLLCKDAHLYQIISTSKAILMNDFLFTHKKQQSIDPREFDIKFFVDGIKFQFVDNKQQFERLEDGPIQDQDLVILRNGRLGKVLDGGIMMLQLLSLNKEGLYAPRHYQFYVSRTGIYKINNNNIHHPLTIHRKITSEYRDEIKRI